MYILEKLGNNSCNFCTDLKFVLQSISLLCLAAWVYLQNSVENVILKVTFQNSKNIHCE